MILIARNELCHTCMKDGPYIRGKSPSKADENKRFISLARDHQKVELPVSYHQGTALVSTNEPVCPI
jgi:hypothetical protein